MPRFPTEETKIIELAQKVASGISNNAATFPNPPAGGFLKRLACFV